MRRGRPRGAGRREHASARAACAAAPSCAPRARISRWSRSHGNVDTRLRKLAAGRLRRDRARARRSAAARRARTRSARCSIPRGSCPLPARARSRSRRARRTTRAREAVARRSSTGATSACLLAERALSRALDAELPHAARRARDATRARDGLLLRAWVGLPDGSAWISDELLGSTRGSAALGARVAERMRAAGAAELLSRAQETAGVAGA